MAKINLNIEADTVEELNALLNDLAMVQQVVTHVQDGVAATAAETMKKVEKSVKPLIDEPVEPTKETKVKKQPSKKAKASTESTAEVELSKTGKQDSTDEVAVEVKEEKSATVGKFPGATKADVQDAMKKAMSDGKRDAIKTAFSRSNATKLSELKEEDYSVFLTDLEVLVGE